MELAPYLFFYGRCEEALEFYKKAIGGDYSVNRMEGSPMESSVPPDWKNKIMHSTFNGPGFSFMASDGRPGKRVEEDQGNIALSLEMESEADGRRVFAALSEGGKVVMEISDAFWGGKFGMLTDKFGTEWMISTP